MSNAVAKPNFSVICQKMNRGRTEAMLPERQKGSVLCSRKDCIKMRNNTMDVLLRIGIPAGVKGTIYICDAMELFDTDPYYPEGKISALYEEIARMHGTTSSRVERAIRHAFETGIHKGKQDLVVQYLDMVNTQNGNLLRKLYFRLKQEERKRQKETMCDSDDCMLKKQIYMEVLDICSAEVKSAFTRILQRMDKEEILIGGNQK